MLMSGNRVLVCIGVILLVSACGEKQEPVSEKPVRPVKIFTVKGVDTAEVRRFPGVIDASLKAEMAFRVSGTIEKISVKEGDRVKKGQVLAQLDPTDFQITVNNRKATAENDARNFERGKQLVAKGSISRVNFDETEAKMKTSAAALALAEQNLAYTKLKAPFGGRVALRYLESFEEVSAKQKVLRLQDQDNLEVKIAVPESLVRSVRRNTSNNPDGMIESYAEFEGKAGKQFPLKIKEVSAKADPQTQTFDITYSMLAPKEFVVLPGMTCKVTVDLTKVTLTDRAYWVPVRAVVAESELKSRVWVLDDKTMTVNSLPVEIGRMSGADIEIKRGLSGGEEIVSLGASYLAEGMKVSRMMTSEQAVPRAGDPG